MLIPGIETGSQLKIVTTNKIKSQVKVKNNLECANKPHIQWN